MTLMHAGAAAEVKIGACDDHRRHSLIRFYARIILLFDKISLMIERTHDDDFTDLIAAAAEALEQALEDEKRQGFRPGTWLDEGFDNHLAHARAHLDELQIP